MGPRSFIPFCRRIALRSRAQRPASGGFAAAGGRVPDSRDVAPEALTPGGDPQAGTLAGVFGAREEAPRPHCTGVSSPQGAPSQHPEEVHALLVKAADAREVPGSLLAPGFRMENHATAVTDYAYHGAHGWREWMEDLFEEFADGARFQLEEVLASGEDFVAATFAIRGRGARSGMPLQFRWAGVTWFAHGLATRSVGFTDESQALAAVGLWRGIGRASRAS
jgi:ketosteroid isomerase-like protein